MSTLRERAHAAGYSLDTIRRAKEAINDFVNVQDLPNGAGAKGDGVADDTQAILKAIERCAPDGVVFFPSTNAAGARAVYRISASIILGGVNGVGKGLTLTGPEGQKPRIVASSNTIDMIRVVPSGPGAANNLRMVICNLQLENGRNGIRWEYEGNGNSRIHSMYIYNVAEAGVLFDGTSPGTSNVNSDIRVVGCKYGFRAIGDQAAQNNWFPNFYCQGASEAAISIEHGEHGDGRQSVTSNICFGPFVTLEGNPGTCVFNRNGEVTLRHLHLENNGSDPLVERPTFILDSTWDGVTGQAGRIIIEQGNQGGENPTFGGTKRYAKVLNQGCLLASLNMRWNPGTGQTVDFQGFSGMFRHEGQFGGTPPIVVNNSAGEGQFDDNDQRVINKLRLGSEDARNAPLGPPMIRAMEDVSSLRSGSGVDLPRGSMVISTNSNPIIAAETYTRWLDSGSVGVTGAQHWYASNQFPQDNLELGAEGATRVKILWGSSSPVGAVAAPPGSLYLQNTGTLGLWYVKFSGTDSSGWFRLESFAHTTLDLSNANGGGASNPIIKTPSSMTGAPANTATPAGWIPIEVNGDTKYLPYYD